jgi:hypothetical protein
MRKHLAGPEIPVRPLEDREDPGTAGGVRRHQAIRPRRAVHSKGGDIRPSGSVRWRDARRGSRGRPIGPAGRGGRLRRCGLLGAALLVLLPVLSDAGGAKRAADVARAADAAVPVRPADAADAGRPADAAGAAGAAGDSLRPPAPVAVRNIRISGNRPFADREIRKLLVRGAGPEIAGDEEAQRALDALGGALVDEGFLEAELRLVLPGRGGTNARAAPRLEVSAGEPARWETLSVTVSAPPAERPRPPAPHGSFDPRTLDREIDDWVGGWTEIGYPFAVATVESLTVSGGRVRAALRCSPGPRMRVDAVAFPGRIATRADFLERWIRFREGRIFRDSNLEASRHRLEQSGLFLSVGDPRLEPIGPDRLRILFPVEEGPHNRIEGALGYSGQTQTLSGFAALELGDLFGTGRSLGVRWDRVQRDQTRFHLEYREPLLGNLPLGLGLLLEQQVQDTTYTLDHLEASLEVSIGWDLFLSVGGEYRRAVLGQEPSEVVRRFSTVLGGRWEGVVPGRWRGGRVAGTLRTGSSRIAPRDGGPTQRKRLDRIEVEALRYWPWGESLLLRGRALAGGLSGGVSEELAPSEALWLGGASTIRGYREEQFATRRYGVAQIEVGVPLAASRGRAYLFTDAAWFRQLAAPGTQETRIGWGAGLTSEQSGRSVSLDFGIPGGSGFREGRLHFRLQTRF